MPQFADLSSESVSLKNSFCPENDSILSYLTITIRTLSGSEIVFVDLPNNTTSRQLKEMIQKRDANFPVHRQKLIRGSQTLLDHETLHGLEIKDRSVIHLVKLLTETSMGVNQHNPEADDSAIPSVTISTSRSSGGNSRRQNNIVNVVAPANSFPGSRLSIDIPGHERLTVILPEGVRPGKTFRVAVPDSPATQPARRHVQTRGPNGLTPPNSIVQVRCPSNARPGSQIQVDIPGRGRMRVTVPNGTVPGMVFRFRVP